MTAKRKRYSAEFKSKVALEAVKGHKTLSELASEYQVHPNMITQWKNQLTRDARDIFSKNQGKSKRKEQEETSYLYQKIGQLNIELDWLKKKLGSED